MFPVKENPVWSIRDSSKIDDFIACNRLYFFHHVLGWKMDVPAHDVHFGSSWHKAREHQLVHGYNDVDGAFSAFLKEYRKYFPPETDSIYVPKTPEAALVGIVSYAVYHQRDLLEHEVVTLNGKKMTEISGTVPVSESRVLHYRLDSIMRRLADNKVFSWDHKSTSGKWIHDTRWDEELFLSIQNGTYTHCLYCLFPIEEVLGVEFCKTGFEFLQRGSKDRSAGYHATIRYIPAFKSPDQMNVWLWTVNDILDDIDREMDRLFHCDDGDPVLMAFRQNPGSCTRFKGCPFHDFCLSWSNPLQHCHQPPLGFKLDFWDPSKMETTNKMNLEWRT